ncbi:MAG: CehA/McbA family metallohydrolase [Sandaracinaceae bacterium]|nr:CehA/McbA family metallohydrolase [Sandaracinaceae bacterium]
MRSPTRIAALLCMLCGVVIIAAQCGGKPLTALQANGVGLRRVEVREPAQHINGVALLPGDWVFDSSALHVVVGGPQREWQMRGAVIELTRRASQEDESIEFLAPRLLVQNRSFPIEMQAMHLLERGGKPVLRIDGIARTPDRVFDVSREFTLGAVPTSLSMTTRVAPQDDAQVDVTVGQRIGWGGDAPWVPGVGVLDDERWHQASYVGSEGPEVGTAFGVHDSQIRLLARYEQHGATRFLEHTEVFSAPRASRKGTPAYERSTLVLGDGDLGEAVRRFGWARGRAFPEILVELPYSPPGAEIEVFTEVNHLPVVHARPDARGQEIVALPPVVREEQRRFLVVAKAFGHASSDEVASSAGQAEPVVVEVPRGGRIRISAHDALSGDRLHARARIIAANLEQPVNLGPDYAADGAGDSVVMPTGEALVPLPPGRYRVLVTHGPEWTLLDQTVEVTETFRPDVRARLSHVVDAGAWVPCDFHVHASPSPDSHVTLEDRIASLLAEGIRFAVPTDHNHVTDYGPAIRGIHAHDFGSVSGIEVSTIEPGFGHFNAYPVPLVATMPGNGAPASSGTTPEVLLPALHRLDPETVVQVNHPRLEGDVGYFDMAGYDPATGYATGHYSDDYEVLEVWNGFDLARKPVFDRVFGEWQSMLTRGRRVVASGNSDSHQIRYQWAGYPRTYVLAPSGADDGRAVIRSLRAGHAFVSSGPFLEVTVDERGPGETVSLRGHIAHVHVRVQAPSWMDVSTVELWSANAVVGSWTVAPVREAPTRRESSPARAVADAPRVNRDLELEFLQDSYLVVIVRGERTMDDYFGRNSIAPVAFSNPIWIDADGDGAGPVDSGDLGNAIPDGGIPVPDAGAAAVRRPGG